MSFPDSEVVGRIESRMIEPDDHDKRCPVGWQIRSRHCICARLAQEDRDLAAEMKADLEMER